MIPTLSWQTPTLSLRVSCTEHPHRTRNERDLFQWGIGISVGFFTETTGFLPNPETRRTPSFVCVSISRFVCLCQYRWRFQRINPEINWLLAGVSANLDLQQLVGAPYPYLRIIQLTLIGLKVKLKRMRVKRMLYEQVSYRQKNEQNWSLHYRQDRDQDPWDTEAVWSGSRLSLKDLDPKTRLQTPLNSFILF